MRANQSERLDDSPSSDGRHLGTRSEFAATACKMVEL